ncbi:MAG: RIP metalloprotease RseP [Calditrichaeota bacterium]|nr:MAG: RIP metalloprotease RseP [Calditrichota bacterium]MBL1204234.1 RIP metalloprotease RseP [Calditrichota bacterium]NOG44064.1 RIP metalloprotease RseP [Calditrichota bacterium]
MSFLGIVAVIFAFSILVLIHELGHYLAARWMGVRVEKFSIGFPPTILSKKVGDTEFSIGAIPLGGYVKMAGFIDENMDSEISGAEDEYSSKPVWKRIIIISAGVIMNLLLAIGLYTFVNYSQGEIVTPITNLKVQGESGIAQKIGFLDGDKIIKINNEYIDTWKQLSYAFFNNIENDIEFEVLRDNETTTLFYKKEWISEKNSEMLNISPIFPATVREVTPGDPAEKTGLKPRDTIIELDDKAISNWGEMTEIIKKNANNSISIKWKRGEEVFSGMVTPKKIHSVDDKGIDKSYGLIGVSLYYEQIKNPVSFAKALKMGIAEPFQMIYMNFVGLKLLVTGVKSAEDTVGGPGTIAVMLSDAANRGWVTYVRFIALLSSVLAFFNTLPIPALDGGHLAFLVVEGIMGRPLSIKTRIVIQQVGMAFLLFLIIFVLYVDINRYF